MNQFTPHSRKQEDALFSTAKITALLTGIQFGKTTIGAVWLRRFVHEFNDETDNYLVTAPTYKIMKQSSLPAFMYTFGKIGRYLSQDAVFKIPNGPTIYFRTGTDPDSVVGITNVRAIWCDEAGLYSLYFWQNIQARASFKQAPIILTSSPYSLNWVFKDIIRPCKKGLVDPGEINLIQARSDENPYFPKAEYERKRRTMDERKFRMIYGGEFERPEGLVYDCFDESTCIIDPYQLPPGTEYYGGIDWGYRDPFVILIRAITPYGWHIDISEFYKTGLKPSQVVEAIDQKHRVYGIKRFYADPSRPDLIAECNSRKLPVAPADNEIEKGIDLTYELIKSGNYRVFRGQTPHLIDEIDSYHYPEEIDLKPDQNKPTKFELPVDQSNHVMDALRYVTLGTYKSSRIHVPKTPIEVHPPAHSVNEHPSVTFEKKIRRQIRFNE